jgi:hypothetical protein
MPPDARTPPGLAPAGGALLDDPEHSLVNDSHQDNGHSARGDLSHDPRGVDRLALPLRVGRRALMAFAARYPALAMRGR